MIGLLAGAAFLAGGLFGPVAALAFLAIALVLSVTTREQRAILFLLPLLCLLGAWRVEQATIDPAMALEPHEAILVGTVLTGPSPAFDHQRFVFETLGETGVSHLICVEAPAAPVVTAGTRLQFPATVTLAADAEQNAARVAIARGCLNLAETNEIKVLSGPTGVQRARVWIQDQIAIAFQTGAPGDAGALLTGFVTGDDSALSWEASSAFIGTGTSHLTAVSGSNFAMLVLIATVLTAGPGSRARIRWIAFVVSLIWAYAWLVEFSPSALRAALMATLVVLALRFGRIPDLLTIAFLSGALQLAIRPSDADSLAFRLSLASTIALVLVLSRSSWAGGLSVVKSFVLVAVVAHLATIPILIGAFGVVPVATVPANVVIAPLVFLTFPMAMVSAGVALVSGTLGAAIAVPVGLPATLIVWLVEFVDQLFPARIQLGSPGPVLVAVVFLITWTLIFLMSDDARNHVERFRWWVGSETAPNRRFAATFLVAAIASGLVLYIWR